MLKTFDDLISFVVLIALAVASTKLFIGSLISNNEHFDNSSSSERINFLKDYINNEEE